MEQMYDAQINSAAIDATITTIEVEDASILPSAPNLLTIDFNLSEPETIKLIEKNLNILTLQREFEGTGEMKIVYDFNGETTMVALDGNVDYILTLIGEVEKYGSN